MINKNSLSAVGLLIVLFYGCQSSKSENQDIQRNKEAREDSVKLANAYQAQSQLGNGIYAVAETDPVQEDPNEDAADDPAIWINPHDPDRSLVFGTNKKSGVHAYDLNGKERQFYEFGKVNNIDVRQGIVVGDKQMDIIGGSNRTDNSIIIHQIDTDGQLVQLLESNFTIDTTDIDEVYGFCLYKNAKNKAFAIVNGKNGRINQYELIIDENGSFDLKILHSWKLDSQPEGMVADDELDFLYIGEEENGIWKLSLVDPDFEVALLPESQQENNEAIEYDIEGLALYNDSKGNGFLLASIQGSFSYAIFDRRSNNYLGSFAILDSPDLDGVEETDGLEIYSFSIGDKFPHGLLVVQDGFNYNDGAMVGQNFKYIDLKDVLDLLPNL